MDLKSIVSLLHEQHYTNKDIGTMLGVTKLQVHYYHRGKTKTPSALVCKAIYDNVRFNGKPILIDLYKTPKELEIHYERELQKLTKK